ncbi:MAG: flagellar hook-length control protein FliK [Hyphomicrobiales bacterium]|nr:flagellar hook-length control protein FliK [Hyphomicrobiales bacterium]
MLHPEIANVGLGRRPRSADASPAAHFASLLEEPAPARANCGTQSACGTEAAAQPTGEPSDPVGRCGGGSACETDAAIQGSAADGMVPPADAVAGTAAPVAFIVPQYPDQPPAIADPTVSAPVPNGTEESASALPPPVAPANAEAPSISDPLAAAIPAAPREPTTTVTMTPVTGSAQAGATPTLPRETGAVAALPRGAQPPSGVPAVSAPPPEIPAEPATQFLSTAEAAATEAHGATSAAAGEEPAEREGSASPASELVHSARPSPPGPFAHLHAGREFTASIATVMPATIMPATQDAGGIAAAPVPLDSLAVETVAQTQAGRQRFEIRLDPPELGRIDVRLDIDRNGQVTSRLLVERAETLDVLRRDAHQLERALQDAGLKTAEGGLQFSLRDQAFAERHHAGDNGAARVRVAETESQPATAAAPAAYGLMLRGGSGVDIRV